jgi:endo-beta-N-acetylglucosaminidase D
VIEEMTDFFSDFTHPLQGYHRFLQTFQKKGMITFTSDFDFMPSYYEGKSMTHRDVLTTKKSEAKGNAYSVSIVIEPLGYEVLSKLNKGYVVDINFEIDDEETKKYWNYCLDQDTMTNEELYMIGSLPDERFEELHKRAVFRKLNT